MRKSEILVIGALILLCVSCVSAGKITRHDFDSGFYKLKNQGAKSARVYANVTEDSIILYSVVTAGKKESPDTSSGIAMKLRKTKTDKYLYKSCFSNNSIDIDLTSILFKYRQPKDDVPAEFSADLNFAVFLGFHKDFYKMTSSANKLHGEISIIRQIGYDLGIFAGIGTSPVNPTNTNNIINQQYDAMIFQKGFAGFISYGKMSLGLALGFDNLMDKNKPSWVFDQKPYLGLVIGISDF
jgi:hypothetical protein